VPIYLVKIHAEPEKIKLVEANSKAAAVNHTVRGLVSAETLTATDVVHAMREGLEVEVATVERQKEMPV
jgi:hypothetical protein